MKYNTRMPKLLMKLVFLFFFLMCFTVPVYAEDEHPEGTPEVYSDYVLLVDRDNEQVLWSRNSSERMYPASMTKMMTEIIAIEALPDLYEQITITNEMMYGLYEANASMAGFLPGDEVTVQDLLYGVALPSGAECVNALAYRIDGSVQAFVDHMNRKAAELGMRNTHFVNPTGLHDQNHYSTCIDLEVLLEYCCQNDTFLEILQTKQYRTGSTASHPDGILMESTVWRFPESEQIPGLIGGKTGFTYPAGRCLASAARINGMDLVMITGKAPEDLTGAIRDASAVYRWCDIHLYRTTLLSAGDSLAYITILDAKDVDSLHITGEDTFTRDVTDTDDIQVIQEFPEVLYTPIEAGQELGKVTVTVNNELLYQKTYYAPETIPFSRIEHYKRVLREYRNEHPRLFKAELVLAGVFIVLVLSVLFRPRKKKKKRRY